MFPAQETCYRSRKCFRSRKSDRIDDHWCTIQSPCFLQVTLNLEVELLKWILIVDIPTQILLIILHSLITFQGVNWKFTLWLTPKRTHQWQIDIICKIGEAIKVKRVSKIWVKMSTIDFIYFDSKFKPLVKTQTLNAGTSGLIPKGNRVKFLTLHLPFHLFIRKILKLIAILSTLESIPLDETIRSALKWFILMLKTKQNKNPVLVNHKCVTYA